MDLLQRVDRIRKLTKNASHLPWSTGKLDDVHDADGKKLANTCLFDDQLGVLGTLNAVNAELIEHMSHLAHHDHMFVVPEMQDVLGEVDRLQQIIWEQANKLFPDRTPSSAFMKLYSEIAEVIDSPSSADEYADVFILLLDLAKMHGVVNLGKAILKKSQVNGERKWMKNALGTYQHITADNAGAYLGGEL